MSTSRNRLHLNRGPRVAARQANINTNKDINTSAHANSEAPACEQMWDKDRRMYAVRRPCCHTCLSCCKTMQIIPIAVTFPPRHSFVTSPRFLSWRRQTGRTKHQLALSKSRCQADELFRAPDFSFLCIYLYILSHHFQQGRGLQSTLMPHRLRGV